MESHVSIAGRRIGPGEPPFLLAEIGINHNGSLTQAVAMLHAAHEAGADGVKFQAFTPERLINPLANRAGVEMFREWVLTPEAFQTLASTAAQLGIPFCCTPFDPEWVQFFRQSCPLAAIKVASSDCTNVPLLEAVGATGWPVILSTGLHSLAEVALGVRTLTEAGAHEIVLLHCVTQYPPAPEEINLRAIATLREHFGCPVGFSDHFEGPLAALGAIAQGACLIEKHFTTDRTLPGPDQAGSADPLIWRQLVEYGALLYRMLGDGVKEAKGREVGLREAGRPGLYAARALPGGHVLGASDLYAARPQQGLPAVYFREVLGQPLLAPLEADQPLAAEWLPDTLAFSTAAIGR